VPAPRRKSRGSGRVRPGASATDGPALSREAILEVALQLVDRDGLDALTMRALADRLDVYPNALYWHVGSRSNLIGALSTVVFDEIELPTSPDVHWRDWLTTMIEQCRAAMHRHPHLAQVLSSQLVPTTRAMPFVERTLAALSGAGFTDDQLPLVYNSVIAFAFGWPAVELSSMPAGADATWHEEFAASLDTLSSTAFPTLTRTLPALRNAAFMLRWESGLTAPLDAGHAMALKILLDGLEAQVATA
jgi:AcrR family transcriptional regulator